MAEKGIAYHYVCTHEEARFLIDNHKSFWVANCGCRERKGKCQVSDHDVCLVFRGDIGSSGGGLRSITKGDAMKLLLRASESNLVTRPFYNDLDRRKSDGICFCCADCCEYFISQNEICDKGRYLEDTDMMHCNRCGICVDYCHFGARLMGPGDMLVVDRDKCYGCGLCLPSCPEGCIALALR